ncbi:MAG: cytochrome c biogenesis protein CcsA [Thermoleophilia bacterium]|nr:cytochrome c biogenesis protein CcsA [Thermoleophilia bacterium]
MILAVVGQALLLVAFLAVVSGAVVGLVGTSRPTLSIAGRAFTTRVYAERALAWAVAACGAAVLTLLIGLMGHNFTLAYVAGRTNRDLSAGFRLTALWSGQEGSLLLWLTVLCTYGLLLRGSLRRASTPDRMASATLGVLLAVASFFALMVAFVARPFAVAAVKAGDGAGMSPALQNYWMAFHPPALYIGYVGVAVPFAIVMGALLSRQRGDAWVALTRRWSLVAWIGLTLGLVLGARWAYEEIGWGGYWAWDPVENAALMPWLTITAFIHSIMVQQRRGMMRWWNVVLVTLSFCLSIFGTFLTRSGVLSSVHSFVSSSVGWWFLGFLAIAIVGSLVMLLRSRDLLKSQNDLDAIISRESAFLFNNLLLVALALMVLWGVVYPILSQGLMGRRVSLQAPWFDFFLVAFGIPLLAIMAIGTVVPWRSGKPRQVARLLAFPALTAVGVGVLLIATGHAGSAAGMAGVSFGTFVFAGIVAEFSRGIRVRRSSEHEGQELSRLAAARSLIGRNRRRWGGYLAHAGIGLIVIAIPASGGWKQTTERNLTLGQTARVGVWSLKFIGTDRHRGANSMQVRGIFQLKRNGRDAGTMRAGRNFYPVSGEISNEVGIRHDLRSGGDLFLIVDGLSSANHIHVKALVNPLINVLWAAAVLVALGGGIAAWPSRRGSRLQPGDLAPGALSDDARHELGGGDAEGDDSVARERVHAGHDAMPELPQPTAAPR